MDDTACKRAIMESMVCFQPKMQQESFVSQALSRPTGVSHTVPTDSLAGSTGGDSGTRKGHKEKKGSKGKWREEAGGREGSILEMHR